MPAAKKRRPGQPAGCEQPCIGRQGRCLRHQTAAPPYQPRCNTHAGVHGRPRTAQRLVRLPDSELARRRSPRLGSTCAVWLRPAENAEGRGVIPARLKVQHQAEGGTSARPATRCASPGATFQALSYLPWQVGCQCSCCPIALYSRNGLGAGSQARLKTQPRRAWLWVRPVA